MRGGESTLSRKARRERTAKAERKLLAKNSSMGSVRGRKRNGHPRNRGKGTARIKNPFPGCAHRAAMAVTSINLRLQDGGRQAPVT